VIHEELELLINLPVREIVLDEKLGLFKVAKCPEWPVWWVVVTLKVRRRVRHCVLGRIRVDDLGGESRVWMIDDQCFSEGKW